MARRPGRTPRGAPPPEDYYEEEYDPRYDRAQSYFRRKRSSGNTGILIALGIAVVVGLVIILFLVGGESSEETGEEALVALQDFMEMCFDGRDAEGMDMVVAYEVMGDKLPKGLVKRWSELPEDQIRGYQKQAYEFLKAKIVPLRNANGRMIPGEDMQLENKAQIGAMLVDALARVTQAGNMVDITWNRRGFDWNAKLDRSTGSWRILRIDRL
jgi:hypothetical protein